jgi:uncharacterized protein YoxC
MDAQLNITVGDLILLLLGIAGVVLIIYLIAFVRGMIETLKKANAVLDEAHTVTGIAAKRVEQVDGIIDDISSSVKSISDNFKGNTSLTKVIAAVVNLASLLKGLSEKTGWFGANSKN